MDASLTVSRSEEMNRATTRARETVRFFFRELAWERRRVIPRLDLAAIRAQHGEGLWMNDVTFDGRDVHGTPFRVPHGPEAARPRDRIEVPLESISDWMYAVRGRVYGAFTVHVLRGHMALTDRKRHDRAWALEFGSPEDVELVPPAWFLPKQTLLERLLGRGSAKLPSLATAEHPMAVDTERALRLELARNPGVVAETNEDGFTLLHQQALAGDARGVRAALEVGADPLARSPLGTTPLDLARVLGWQDVVAVLERHVAVRSPDARATP